MLKAFKNTLTTAGTATHKHTLEFLDKKHVKFDQGLDFLIFEQGNQGQTYEKPTNNKDNIRTNKDNL